MGVNHMLQPLHPASNNAWKCYLWALLNPTQLPDFEFYPRLWKSGYAKRLVFDFANIKAFIYVHPFYLELFIPDSVWIAYLTAYDVPADKQRDYYVGCPF
jgi:hypothetical protein